MNCFLFFFLKKTIVQSNISSHWYQVGAYSLPNMNLRLNFLNSLTDFRMFIFNLSFPISCIQYLIGETNLLYQELLTITLQEECKERSDGLPDATSE